MGQVQSTWDEFEPDCYDGFHTKAEPTCQQRRWHADGFDGDGDRTPGGTGSNAGSKSMGYGRQMAPAAPFKGQSIEDYADDPEYYAQLQELYAGGAGTPSAGG